MAHFSCDGPVNGRCLNRGGDQFLALATINSVMFSLIGKNEWAVRIGLVAPYLGYMRQDKRFQPGEAITSNVYAKHLSVSMDWMATIDPHLHRR